MVVTPERVQSPNPIASQHSRSGSSSQLRPPAVMPKPSLGPSRLSQILQKLKADPKPVLAPSLRSLKLTYAKRNDHFGARCVRRSSNDPVAFSLYVHSDALHCVSVGNYRHFVNDELPRIQYANPTIAIEVNKVPKFEADTWQSSLYMEFGEFLLASILITEH